MNSPFTTALQARNLVGQVCFGSVIQGRQPTTGARAAKLFGMRAWLLVFCLFLGGCFKMEQEVLSREQMWSWLGERVQLGMPLAAASEVMQKAGFTCQRFTKTPVKIVDINKHVTKPTCDFLKCEREDGSPPVRRLWEVTFVHDGSKINEIGVRYADVYP